MHLSQPALPVRGTLGAGLGEAAATAIGGAGLGKEAVDRADLILFRERKRPHIAIKTKATIRMRIFTLGLIGTSFDCRGS
jgi:hypothetical protein